jgi:ABC-2 type transport system permease protein
MTEATIARPKPRAAPVVATIAGKELKEILRDGRFAWTAAIMALLLVAALITGFQRYTAYREMMEQAQATANGQFYTQGDKNPHSGAHYGEYAFKQAGPLGFFDSGVNAYAGSLVFMEAHKQNLALSPPAADVSAVARFGDLNGAMILQVLMPLLIIFLGFSTFAGERERGTLRHLLSVGVSRRSLLWGKALGVGAAVALVVVPCILAGAAVIAALGVPAGESLGARIALMVLAYGVYGLIFLFLTLAVSAVANSPRTALIVLVGFWAFTVFLAPKAAAEISKVVHPTPALGKFQTDLQETRRKGLGGPPPRARLAIYRAQLLRKYGVKDVSQLPIYWVSTSMQKLEEMDHEFYDHHYKGLNNAYLEQRRLQDGLGVAAPLLPLSSLSMGLAGSDLLHQIRFAEAAEQFRRDMVTKMNSYLSEMAVAFNANLASANNISVETNDRVLIAPQEVFKRVPPFRYEAPPLAVVLREYGLAMLVLAGWLVAAVLAAVVAVGRLRPQTR